jgi:endonuclease G, mitochondrial
MATINSRLDETTKRYQQREEMRSRNEKALSSNNPSEILKLESEERKEIRKRLLHLGDESVLERIILGNDLMPINYLDIGKRTSESICRIEIKDEQGRTMGYGTGFMVSPSLMITNNHVLENFDLCRKSLAQFRYEDDEKFLPKTTVTFPLDPDLFFYTNEPLDFTLVGVSSKAVDGTPLSSLGYLRLIGTSGKAIIGEYVSSIQHPKGDKKNIAIRENRIVDIFEDFVHYVTDTHRGSSGSPVCNDQWNVVALHHSGVPKRDEQGNVMSIYGKKWTPDMSDDEIEWIANEGVRISKIIQHLKMPNINIPAKSKEKLKELLAISNSI